MDESDSDRDDDAPERSVDVPYPLDGKYVDEADKRRIQGLSQLEREEILGQRAEETQRAHFTAELQRRAAQGNDRKRKADSEEPDERKSSRPKVQPRKNEKLEAYKREREQRGQQRPPAVEL
jgi:RNA polymerase-associated protein RTF1